MTKCVTLALTTGPNKLENIESAFQLMEKAVRQQSPDWIVLPEVFTCFGSAKEVAQAGETDSGILAKQLAQFASKHGVTIFAGSMQELAPSDGRVFNTSLVFGPTGVTIAKYRKTHLFSLKDSTGNSLYDETVSYEAGSKLCAFSHEGKNIWLAICYDLRFPGFFEALYNKFGAPDVIVIPAAFTFQTGKDHWLTLLRARAIEYQCYVIAANQVGYHSKEKRSFGHSVIIDPWGEILGDTADEIGYASGVIELDKIHQVRSKLPALRNRRDDIY